MDEQLLTILKLCLLALLYLFFLRVLRAVWTEVRGPRTVERRARRGAPAGPVLAAAGAGAATALPPAAAPARGGRRAERKADRNTPSALTVVEPANLRGTSYPLADELTVGRAAGCHVTVDDTFASQIHARVFSRDGQLFVEDLGSTNGTYLNRTKVAGPQVMRRGDRLQVGNTVLELV
jgi:hypothetical protein